MKKGSKRPRGLSLFLERLVVLSPELAFAHGLKLILNAAQNIHQGMADLLQMAVNTLELFFQVVSSVVDRWHTTMELRLSLYTLR